VLCDELIKLGIKTILLFGISDKKDDDGSIACSEDSIIPFAIKKIKNKFRNDILVMADLCNCSYTSHGHCGTIENNDVDNDKTIKTLCNQGTYSCKVRSRYNRTFRYDGWKDCSNKRSFR
jgi:porphobilinogen synthase